MNYIIRRYKQTDIPKIIEVIKTFMNENRDTEYSNYFKGIDFNEEKVYKELTFRENDNTFFCDIVLDENEHIVGGLSADLIEYYFSTQKIAHDRMFYLQPGFNDRRVLSQLLKRYKDWAMAMNALEIQLCNSTGFKQEAFARFVKMQGFKQFSIGFSMRLE